MPDDVIVVPVNLSGVPTTGSAAANLSFTPVKAKVGKESIKIDFEIKLPKKEKKKKKEKVEKKTQGSCLSTIFTEHRFPEPVYFQEVDCVGLPDILSYWECDQIIEFAEAQGFSYQQRHHLMDFQWTDIVDPFFAEALWKICGLERFLRRLTLDGMRPCGVNEIIRIQKYEPGCSFGKHIDQQVQRQDGRISKYSLRIYLNGLEESDQFQGGNSAFHVPGRSSPVVFEPESGLALLYPQGDLCTVQSEYKVTAGVKYVLRADILFEDELAEYPY